MVNYHGTNEGVGYGVIYDITLQDRVNTCNVSVAGAAAAPVADVADDEKSVNLVGGSISVSWKFLPVAGLSPTCST